MMKKKILSIFIILIMLPCMVCPVFATESKSTYQNKINDANQEITEIKTEIDSALQEVEDLNTSISQMEKEVADLQSQSDELTKSISEKEAELAEKEQLLEDRLVAMYMEGNTSYLDVILSGGFVNFVSNYYMVTQIADCDTQLINDVETMKTTLEEEKNQVETVKVQKEEKSKSLKSLKSQKQAKVDSLTDEQKSLESQIEEWDQKMDEIDAAEKKALAEAAAKAKASGSSTTTYNYTDGKLQWPVPASTTISSPYGYRVHPIYGTYKFHSGIDISASTGSSIVAAEAGTVILASTGYNGGYGNYIIIDHGNGLTTRYAHCNSLSVSVGQTVSRGQTIAAVGSTGASTGPHCHFEVRENGTTKNPTEYL